MHLITTLNKHTNNYIRSTCPRLCFNYQYTEECKIYFNSVIYSAVISLLSRVVQLSPSLLVSASEWICYKPVCYLRESPHYLCVLVRVQHNTLLRRTHYITLGLSLYHCIFFKLQGRGVMSNYLGSLQVSSIAKFIC